MKLRGRLALVVVATIVPLVAGAAWGMSAFWDHLLKDSLRHAAFYAMENGGRAACERDPATFALPQSRFPAPTERHRPDVIVPPGGHVAVYAYDASFVSANPAAPAFPAPLREALERGDDTARTTSEGHRGEVLGLRTPWRDGPCAYLLAFGDSPTDLRAMHDLVVGSVFVGAGLVVVVLLVLSPTVTRVRLLAAGVRRSAEDRWLSRVDERGSDEIADLARAFNAAAAEVRAKVGDLERRERTLREFVANTDHDLTVPLTVLLGHLAEMRRRAEAGEAVGAEILRDAAREADYMASLIRNLGVAARLEAGEPDAARAPVDLNALVARAVARNRPIASSAGVALDFAVPECVAWTDGDETLLEQAASNLVHNAVRHNRRGGHVAVTLDTPKDAPGRFALRVADDGPGLPPEVLSGLAADARAADARPRAAGASGLGLRIVRRVAERHGMRLVLAPRDGGGLSAEIQGPLRGA